jgi:hypothetical protein
VGDNGGGWGEGGGAEGVGWRRGSILQGWVKKSLLCWAKIHERLGEDLVKGDDVALEAIGGDAVLEGFLFRRRIWKELQD